MGGPILTEEDLKRLLLGPFVKIGPGDVVERSTTGVGSSTVLRLERGVDIIR